MTAGLGRHLCVLVVLFCLFGSGFLGAGLGLLCGHFLVSVIIGILRRCRGFPVGLCLKTLVFALLLVKVVYIYLQVFDGVPFGFVRGCIA